MVGTVCDWPGKRLIAFGVVAKVKRSKPRPPLQSPMRKHQRRTCKLLRDSGARVAPLPHLCRTAPRPKPFGTFPPRKSSTPNSSLRLALCLLEYIEETRVCVKPRRPCGTGIGVRRLSPGDKQSRESTFLTVPTILVLLYATMSAAGPVPTGFRYYAYGISLSTRPNGMEDHERDRKDRKFFNGSWQRQ